MEACTTTRIKANLQLGSHHSLDCCISSAPAASANRKSRTQSKRCNSPSQAYKQQIKTIHEPDPCAAMFPGSAKNQKISAIHICLLLSAIYLSQSFRGCFFGRDDGSGSKKTSKNSSFEALAIVKNFPPLTSCPGWLKSSTICRGYDLT